MFLIFNPALFANTPQFNFQPHQTGGDFSPIPIEMEFDNITLSSGSDWFSCVLNQDVTCHKLWKKIVCLAASALPILISLVVLIREAVTRASKEGLKNGINSMKHMDDVTITIPYWKDKSWTFTVPLSAIATYLSENPLGVIITSLLTISITEIAGRMCRCALCR